jgi:perosamine synthetase
LQIHSMTKTGTETTALFTTAEMHSPEKLVGLVRALYPRKEFIPLHKPVFAGNEQKYVADCIQSTFVSSVGRYVSDVELRLAEYTGARYAVACVNGTAALHIALVVTGVGQNDLVITQSLSFIATCNAIRYTGADPLFIDVDRASLGMDPDKLEAYLAVNTKTDKEGVTREKSTGRRIAACVPMHTFGHPCRIDRIAEVCERHGITLIEDSAESIGSWYSGRHTGTFGKLGVFSFNGNKTITCGGGGAVVTDDEALAKRMKHLTTQAKKPHRWDFDHDETGYNYRMPNLNAAMLYAQFEELDGFLSKKREVAAAYEKFFAGSAITFVSEPAHSKSNYWLCSALLPDRKTRDAYLTYTNDNGVMTRPSWKPMHQLSMFSDTMQADLTVTEEIADRLISLPSSVPC